jgi:hypothetical protein
LSLADLNEIEQKINLQERVIATIVKKSADEHWQPFGDKMYLTGDGGMELLRYFGLSSRMVGSPQWIDLGEGIWQCIVEVEVERAGRTHVEFGDCDSLDSFLTARRDELAKQGAPEDKIPLLLKPYIMKKAYMNGISRAASGWLGIKGLKTETIAAMRGSAFKGKAVQFGKGKAGGKIEVVTCKDAAGLALKSLCSLRGRVTGIIERSGDKPRCQITINDDTAIVNVVLWKAKPAGLDKGMEVFFPSVKVGEYQGQRQYSADDVQPVEDGNGDDAASNG